MARSTNTSKQRSRAPQAEQGLPFSGMNVYLDAPTSILLLAIAKKLGMKPGDAANLAAGVVAKLQDMLAPEGRLKDEYLLEGCLLSLRKMLVRQESSKKQFKIPVERWGEIFLRSALGESYRELARAYHASAPTIKRIVDAVQEEVSRAEDEQ